MPHGGPTSSAAGSAPGPAVLDLLRISRPAGWLVAVGIFRIGMAYGGRAEETPLTAALTAALSFPFCLFLFGLNDLHDARSDADNPRKRGAAAWLYGGRVGPRNVRRTRAGVAVAGIGLVALAFLLPLRAAAVLLAVLAVSTAYSRRTAGLPRLKEVPIVDGLASAAIIGGLLALGYAMRAPLTGLPVEPFAFVPAMVGLHVFASVMDVESDRLAGQRTLPARIGPRGASLVALALSAGTAAAIPVLDFAPAIAVCAVLQAAAIAASVAFPSFVTPRRAFVGIGLASGVGMVHVLFVEL